MALMAVISGVTHKTAATWADFAHNLGTTPDIVIPVILSGGALSGEIVAVATGAASLNASNFSLTGTVGSLAFNALCIKFHSIVR